MNPFNERQPYLSASLSIRSIAAKLNCVYTFIFLPRAVVVSQLSLLFKRPFKLLSIIHGFFRFCRPTEMNGGVLQTDSMSNISDISGNTAIQTQRPHMDVVCVIDTVQAEHLNDRKCAFDELKQACSLVNANFRPIQVI